MFEILVDKYNKPGKHPEEKDLERYGYPLTKVCLPVGDYCVKTYKLQEMIDIRRHEQYTQRNWHNDMTAKCELQKLDIVGTYTVAVDTKKDFNELGKNLLNSKQGNRYRFERELMRAKNLGIKLYIVTADDEYKSFHELDSFRSSGSGLCCGREMKERMALLMKKYGCEFYLTSKDRLARQIIQLLSQEPLLRSGYVGNVFQMAN